MVIEIKINGMVFKTNKKLYLLDSQCWTEDWAQFIAAVCDIFLAEQHWKVMHWLQRIHRDTKMLPAYISLLQAFEFGEDEFKKLFPGGIKLACKMAGLPEPEGFILNCSR